MSDINNRQITDNCLSKAKSNSNFLLKNKNKNFLENNNKINNHLLLYKCSSKPNISNMKLKLNNILKLNPKIEKENKNLDLNVNIIINTKENNFKENNFNNEIGFIQRIKPNNNNALNEKEIKKLFARLTSENSFNNGLKTSNLKSYNSYNQSVKINKLQKNYNLKFKFKKSSFIK